MKKKGTAKSSDWQYRKQLAIQQLREGVDPKLVSANFGMKPGTVWKWNDSLKRGKQVHERSGRPTNDALAMKEALLRAFNGKRYIYCDGPIRYKIPFLPPVPHSLVKDRLQTLGIYKSQNTIPYWLKRLGWTQGKVPKDFIARYEKYIESRCDEDIEEIVRNRSRVRACLLPVLPGEVIPRLAFELVPFKWEDWDKDTLSEMSEFEKTHESFLSHPCPDDPWQGETVTSADVIEIREYLISEATQTCTHLYAQLYHYCQNEAHLEGNTNWSGDGELLPVEMNLSTSFTKTKK